MSVASLDGMAEEYKLEQDHKRELDQKHKWALGEVEGIRGHPGRRPGKPETQSVRRVVRRLNGKNTAKPAHGNTSARKVSSLVDKEFTTSDSSAEEDVKEASAAPVPDAGITYSYDASHGPHGGSEILTMAINKAVERFETRVTEKLVKDEYEVVRKDAELDHEGYVADEDDFELV